MELVDDDKYIAVALDHLHLRYLTRYVATNSMKRQKAAKRVVVVVLLGQSISDNSGCRQACAWVHTLFSWSAVFVLLSLG